MGKYGRKFVCAVDIFNACSMVKIVIDIYVMLVIHEGLNGIQWHPPVDVVMDMIMIVVWVGTVMVVVVVIVVADVVLDNIIRAIIYIIVKNCCLILVGIML